MFWESENVSPSENTWECEFRGMHSKMHDRERSCSDSGQSACGTHVYVVCARVKDKVGVHDRDLRISMVTYTAIRFPLHAVVCSMHASHSFSFCRFVSKSPICDAMKRDLRNCISMFSGMANEFLVQANNIHTPTHRQKTHAHKRHVVLLRAAAVSASSFNPLFRRFQLFPLFCYIF